MAKKLRTLVIANAQTDQEGVKSVLSAFRAVDPEYEVDIERAIERAGSGAYELLLVDKDLPSDSFNKIVKLADVFFPDVVVTSLNFSDKEFMQHKMNDLYNDWAEAQKPVQRRFLDNPAISQGNLNPDIPEGREGNSE